MVDERETYEKENFQKINSTFQRLKIKNCCQPCQYSFFILSNSSQKCLKKSARKK